MPPMQSRNSNQQMIFFEDDSTQRNDRLDKMIDVHQETCEANEAADQSGPEFQSPCTKSVSLQGAFQTSHVPIGEDHIEKSAQEMSLSPPRGFVGGSFLDMAEAPSSPSTCPKQPYFDMTLPVSLPPPLRTRIPASRTSSAGKAHPFHQLLLVLNYLFVTAMLPEDKGALWATIYRSDQDWETSFVLQYGRLQPWLTDIRAALAESQGLHTMSCDDLGMQIRFILFLLGQHASHDSSLVSVWFEHPCFPYRPFGVGASIALICCAFMGIDATHIRGYESKEIWLRDESFFCIMLVNLRMSPIFSSGLSMEQLRSILMKLHQNEEVRVASVKPQGINVSNSAEMRNYYTQAFLSLGPLILSRISLIALEIEQSASYDIHQLATISANAFYDRNLTQYIDRGFKGFRRLCGQSLIELWSLKCFMLRCGRKDFRVAIQKGLI
ncbi:unnamed protein product [Penicillium pancosmium]